MSFSGRTVPASGALFHGGVYGGFVALYPALTVDYYGRRNASGIIGILYTGCSIGTFVGVLLASAAFDAVGSYTLPIAASAAFALVATVLVILTAVFSSKTMCASRIDHLKPHREAEQL